MELDDIEEGHLPLITRNHDNTSAQQPTNQENLEMLSSDPIAGPSPEAPTFTEPQPQAATLPHTPNQTRTFANAALNSAANKPVPTQLFSSPDFAFQPASNNKRCLAIPPFGPSKRLSVPSTRNGTTANTPMPPHSSGTQSLILQARALLIQAMHQESNHDVQSRLCDLLEVFREYTEKGITATSTVSKIMATQVVQLESVTRKLEATTRKVTAAPGTQSHHNVTVPPTKRYADVLRSTIPATTAPLLPPTTNPPRRAHTAAHHNQPPAAEDNAAATTNNSWKTVTGVRTRTATKQSRKEIMKEHRLILSGTSLSTGSALSLRNKFNDAFVKAGLKDPVVASITTSRNNNLVITTTPQFTADYMLEKEHIWKNAVTYKEARRDQSWYKIVMHGIPLQDFNHDEGMDLVVTEITTFNEGLTPVGRPYWLTSSDKRRGGQQRAGSVVVAFATEREALRAVRNRVYVAGISVRCEKLHNTAPSTQCTNCQSFGHLGNRCKKAPSCCLCGEAHATTTHRCNTCQSTTQCIHLTPRCINCQQAHTADSKVCEVYLSTKKTPTGAHNDDEDL